MVRTCFVEKCSHKGKSYNSDCMLHRFPNDPECKKIWTNFSGRTDREPSENDRICSCHFDGEQKDPTIFSNAVATSPVVMPPVNNCQVNNQQNPAPNLIHCQQPVNAFTPAVDNGNDTGLAQTSCQVNGGVEASLVDGLVLTSSELEDIPEIATDNCVAHVPVYCGGINSTRGNMAETVPQGDVIGDKQLQSNEALSGPQKNIVCYAYELNVKIRGDAYLEYIQATISDRGEENPFATPVPGRMEHSMEGESSGTKDSGVVMVSTAATAAEMVAVVEPVQGKTVEEADMNREKCVGGLARSDVSSICNKDQFRKMRTARQPVNHHDDEECLLHTCNVDDACGTDSREYKMPNAVATLSTAAEPGTKSGLAINSPSKAVMVGGKNSKIARKMSSGIDVSTPPKRSRVSTTMKMAPD